MEEFRDRSRVTKGMTVAALLFAWATTIVLTAIAVASRTSARDLAWPSQDPPDYCTRTGTVCARVQSPGPGTPSEGSKPHQRPNGGIERPSRGVVRHVTAYNSVPWQTDDTPCIAADGSDICRRAAAGETICAANFVPLGTRLEILTAAGEAITCTVADRMNRRFSSRVDLYMGLDIERARRFGIQNLYVALSE